MKQKFFFPLNYDYSSKFLGIIEYKVLTPFIVYGIALFFILKQFDLEFFTFCGSFTILFLPPVLILNSRVHNEPFYSFIVAIITHFLNSKIYLYKRVIWCGINLKLLTTYKFFILFGPEYLKIKKLMPPYMKLTLNKQNSIPNCPFIIRFFI